MNNPAVNESMRKGFGRGLVTAGEQNDRVVALCADLTESLQMASFRDAYPERFIQVGVAEQNLVTVASGLASMGQKPFAGSYASFSPGRNWEQIRTTICLNDQPVCIVGSHAGLSVGADGGTHQMLEDIALMRSLPGMCVIAPGDSREAEKATIALASYQKPSYIRLSREATPIFMADDGEFEIGKAYVLREGHDISLLSTGIVSYNCLMVADKLQARGISVDVVHVPTIKPLDEATVLASLKRTGRAITVEEGQIAGGFGGAIAELASEKLPMPIKRLGVDDQFGESGTTDELFAKFGLMPDQIADTVIKFCKETPQYHRGES